ncbi:hypothetical protein FEM48_Zijuj05G0176000 [Ziziphus jujuba var. spinosa]|uniref:Uncharacterized protein n=1 Tax=Ziziphus jujuba var. spinosa TaxID=714518 RepID=A0A978VG71_ZIZJJ|nr:hypothetical protein FEM48_Zijuj05G0176000 [Ziziphus jujuba var. spinosa]
MLKLPEQRTPYLNAKSFLKIKRLRLRIFANVVLSGAIEYLPNELRLIDLPGYQFPTFSFNSGPKQLAVLNMPYSHIHQLDKGFKVQLLFEINESDGFLNKLVRLDARCCSNLKTVPNLSDNKFVSRLSKLSDLSLANCQRLQEIPELLGFQISIKASHCKSLVETPWEIMAKIISNDTVRSMMMSTACGIHILCDGDEIIIEGKPIKVSDTIAHTIDKTFDDFANGGIWSSRQKREYVSAGTNMSETEDWEEEEKLANIIDIGNIEEELTEIVCLVAIFSRWLLIIVFVVMKIFSLLAFPLAN